MVVDEMVINNIRDTQRICISKELEAFLLEQYGEEPFPYEFSEQDLLTNIERDICAYEAGELRSEERRVGKKFI